MTFPPHVRLKLLSSLPVSLQNDVIYSVSDLNPEGMVKEGIDSLKDFNFSEIYYLFSTQDFIPYHGKCQRLPLFDECVRRASRC